MKRTILLSLVVAMLTLVLAQAPAFSQNDISCPEGSAANAAGTTCTDTSTGEQVEPISQTLVNPAPNSSPCPESSPERIYRFEDGKCVQLPGPLATDTTPTPESIPEVAPVENIVPEAPATEKVTELPRTGGFPLSAVAILAVGSYMLVRRFS